MNVNDKNNIGELRTHIIYIRESIDEIKRITEAQQKELAEQNTRVSRIEFLGPVIIFIVSIASIVINMIF